MIVKYREYEIDENINTLSFRLDFLTFDIAVKIVDWLQANIEAWHGDTRNYIGEYDKDFDKPDGYYWLIPFYVGFLNEDDYFKFKMVWG